MKRKAFGMMYALVITVLVATLGVFSIRFSTSSLNATTNEHIAIQLDLYLDSTIELAILYAQRYGFVNDENNRPRPNPLTPITKNINYGINGEYKFTYKLIPTHDNSISKVDEDMKNAMILDVSGFVISPITNQTFRATKRQVIKP